MKPLPNTFSIVVVGSWNPAIFQPSWISEHLASTADTEITLSMSPDAGSPLQLEFDRVRMYPAVDRLQIMAKVPTREGMGAVFEVFQKIVEVLNHTPIYSVGVNFSFIEDTDNQKISSWLGLGDESIDLPTGYVDEAVQVVRRLRRDPKCVLNFALACLDGNNTNLSFNYDFGVDDVEAYVKGFNVNEVNSRYDETIEFCKSALGLDLEENTNE